MDAAAYGGDKAIFAYGDPASTYPREGIGATNYGGDKAIFFAGSGTGVSNLVSNSGVVAADVARVGSIRQNVTGAGYSFNA